MDELTESIKEEIKAANQHIEKASNTARVLQEFTVNIVSQDADANVTELGHCVGMVGSFVKASYTIFLKNLLEEMSKCIKMLEPLKKKFHEHCVNSTHTHTNTHTKSITMNASAAHRPDVVLLRSQR